MSASAKIYDEIARNRKFLDSWIESGTRRGKGTSRRELLSAWLASDGQIAQTSRILGLSKQAVHQSIDGLTKGLPCYDPEHPEKCRVLADALGKEEGETDRILRLLASRAYKKIGKKREKRCRLPKSKIKEEFQRIHEDADLDEKLLKGSKKAIVSAVADRLLHKSCGTEKPSREERLQAESEVDQVLSLRRGSITQKTMALQREIEKALRKPVPCRGCEKLKGALVQEIEKEMKAYTYLLTEKELAMIESEKGWLESFVKTPGNKEAFKGKRIIPCGNGKMILDQEAIDPSLIKSIRRAAIDWIAQNRKVGGEAESGYITTVPKDPETVEEILKASGCSLRVSREKWAEDARSLYFLIRLAGDGADTGKHTSQKMAIFRDSKVPIFVDLEICDYAKKKYEEKRKAAGNTGEGKCDIRYLVNIFTKKHKLNPGEAFIREMLKEGCGIPIP